MERINFEDTTITRQPYVTIDNVDYEVHDGTYQGGTDLDAETFNTLQNNIEEAINELNSDKASATDLGDISDLTTTDKTSAVAAINEINSAVGLTVHNSYSQSTTEPYSANYVNNLHTYSTDEIRVGTWIDGKPLYRKTLFFPNGTGSTSVTGYSLSDYGITNVDTIYITQPSYYSLGSGKYPFQFYDGNIFGCNVSPTALQITLSYNQIANSPFLITLEYTKTTD